MVAPLSRETTNKLAVVAGGVEGEGGCGANRGQGSRVRGCPANKSRVRGLQRDRTLSNQGTNLINHLTPEQRTILGRIIV